MLRPEKHRYSWLWKPTLAVSVLTLTTLALGRSAERMQRNVENTPPQQDAPENSPSNTPDSTPTNPPGSNSPGQPGQASQRMIFEANLMPLNADVSSPVTGTAKFVIDGNHLGVGLEAFGLAPQVQHWQEIRAGEQCPGANADQNGDGKIDAAELTALSGPPILNLALNPQQTATGAPGSSGPGSSGPTSSRNETFPMAGPDGHLLYINVFPLSSMISGMDMTHPSPATTPSSSPSSPSPSASDQPDQPDQPNGQGSRASLEKHIIVIHGVSADTSLPSSVRGESGRSSVESLPIACGVIVRVNE